MYCQNQVHNHRPFATAWWAGRPATSHRNLKTIPGQEDSVASMVILSTIYIIGPIHEINQIQMFSLFLGAAIEEHEAEQHLFPVILGSFPKNRLHPGQWKKIWLNRNHSWFLCWEATLGIYFRSLQDALLIIVSHNWDNFSNLKSCTRLFLKEERQNQKISNTMDCKADWRLTLSLKWNNMNILKSNWSARASLFFLSCCRNRTSWELFLDAGSPIMLPIKLQYLTMAQKGLRKVN